MDKPIRSTFTILLIVLGVYILLNIVIMFLHKMNVGWATTALTKGRYVLPGYYALPFIG